MFGLGLPEILFILLLAALILGPEHMPRAARMLGQWSSRLRSAATTFSEAVAKDEDLSAFKDGIAEVRGELQSAKSELLSTKNEVVQVSKETHEAFIDAQNELKRIQAFTGRDSEQHDESKPENQSDEKMSEQKVEPSPSPFMSKPIGECAHPESEPVRGIHIVHVSKARFLPESVSLLVSRRRYELAMPVEGRDQRVVHCEEIRKNAGYCCVRKLELPLEGDKSAVRAVKL